MGGLLRSGGAEDYGLALLCATKLSGICHTPILPRLGSGGLATGRLHDQFQRNIITVLLLLINFKSLNLLVVWRTAAASGTAVETPPYQGVTVVEWEAEWYTVGFQNNWSLPPRGKKGKKSTRKHK